MKNLILVALLALIPSICTAEAYYDTLNSPSPSSEMMTQRAQDIISETSLIAKKMQCEETWKNDSCGDAYCNWIWCKDINSFNADSACRSKVNALNICRNEQLKDKNQIRCSQNKSSFTKAWKYKNYYQCNKILKNSQDCSDWYRGASKALYEATKKPDFPSAAQSRPNYKPTKVKSSTQAGSLCPKQNPGRNSKNKWDTNRNPKDGTYVLCNYFNDGVLSYQAPYVNNRKDGLVLMYQNNAPHRLANSIQYSKGRRNGNTATYVNDRSKYYLLRVTSYNNDQATRSKQWYSNGKVSKETIYDKAGNVYMQYNYAKNGKLTSCTKWNHKRQPTSCK